MTPQQPGRASPEAVIPIAWADNLAMLITAENTFNWQRTRQGIRHNTPTPSASLKLSHHPPTELTDS